MMSATIDGTINWSFTLNWLFACVALVSVSVLAGICYQIWRETR